MEKIRHSIVARDDAPHTIKSDIDPQHSPSPYTFLRIRQTVQALKLEAQGWKPGFVSAVKESMRHHIPPNLPLGCLRSRSHLSLDLANSSWAEDHVRMVNEGNDAWIRVFGEEMDANDIVLSDEDEPSTSQFPRSLGTLNSRSNLWIDPATSAWAKEHARMVDEGNDDWIGVYGQEMDADDIQLSDEDEPGTSHSPRSTRKASDLKTTRSVHREITHDLADYLEEAWRKGFLEKANNWKQPDLKRFRTRVVKQFVEYAKKVVDSHEDRTSSTAIEDFDAAADLLSTDFVIGHYTVGQLLINSLGAEIERGGEKAEKARGEAIDMFRAYITCVLGPRRKAYIAELKGFLVHALKDAGSGVAHPIVAAWKQRTHFFEQAKHAAGRARKLVSVIFVRPQNGPKDIRSHPNVGKYVITTPDNTYPPDGPLKKPDKFEKQCIFIKDPTYISPIFEGLEQTPLASPADRRPYKPQVVLVFQLDENMPESIRKLYEQIKDSTRRVFLTPSQLELIPWDNLHRLSSFVTASVFARPGIRDMYDFKKAKMHLRRSSEAHTAFGRAGDRTSLGSGASMGSRADQRGHAGSYLRNFRSGVSDEEQAYIRVNDEQNMDMLNIMIAQVFPDLIPDEYVALSYHSSVPPSGARGFAASGAAGFNYLSSQHVEPDDDPLWTMGMTLSAGDVDPRSHNFCFSALDDGRGVIALNYPFTPHIWRGKEFIHGGTVGPSTFDHKDPALGLGVYQKTRLQSFSQRDASLFPSSFEMPIGRSARFKPGALRWVI